MLVVPLFLLQNTKAPRLATARLTGILSYVQMSTWKPAMPSQQQAPAAASHITRTLPPALTPRPRENKRYH